MTNAKRMIFSSAILLIVSMLVAAVALASEHQLGGGLMRKNVKNNTWE